MDEHTQENRAVSRRRALLELGGFAATALGVGAFGAKELLDADEAGAAGSGPAAVASGLVSCVLAPEMTEGPYYVEGDKVRRNITEGRPGVPLVLRLGVVDASSCKPIRNAAVDVWQCDAGGTYSATAQEGTEGLTFLRGIQRTDRKGVATFRTIYPGWYPGRTVHIHLKVYLGGTTVHTGQLFFADRVTDAVYRRPPYNRRPNRDPRNAGDSIFRNGGSRSLLALTKNGSGYVGRITMGVTRS
jgi:protocatechuate 3,4-dioxygenase beta subunit